MQTALPEIISPRRQALVILLVVVCAYFVALFNGFAFDEEPLLTKNPAVQGLGFSNLKTVLLTLHNGMEYLPVRDLTYMLDTALWGTGPFGYHLSNVIYYALCCLLVLRFSLLLLKGLGYENNEAHWASFIVACVFAAHPIHTESVAGVSQRKDLVMGAFYLLTLIEFLRYRSNGSRVTYIYSLLFCLCALLSKGTAVTLPLVVLVLDVFYLRSGGGIKKLAVTAPFFIVAGAVTALNTVILARAELLPVALLSSPLKSAVLIVKASVLYLKMLFIPWPLTIWHVLSIGRSPFEPTTLLSALVVTALCLAALVLRRRSPVISFSILWFFVTLAPVLYFVPTHLKLSERYLFLPSLGFALTAAVCFVWLLKTKAAWRKPLVALFCIAIIAAAGLSARATLAWKDRVSLRLNALRAEPGSAMLNSIVGREFFLLQDYQRAFEYFGRARRINYIVPDYAFYSAFLKHRQGLHKEALSDLQGLSSMMGMDMMDLHSLKGDIYTELDRPQKALESFQKALRSHNNIFAPYYNKRYALKMVEKLKSGQPAQH